MKLTMLMMAMLIAYMFECVHAVEFAGAQLSQEFAKATGGDSSISANPHGLDHMWRVSTLLSNPLHWLHHGSLRE